MTHTVPTLASGCSTFLESFFYQESAIMQTNSMQITALETANVQLDGLNHTVLRGVIESLLDGILIVTEDGELIQISTSAKRVCDRLTPNPLTPDIPQEIWGVCQTLINSRRSYDPDAMVVIEDAITTEQFSQLRIRARWILRKTSDQPYILVLLEDRYLTNQHLAIAEAIQYHLTPRETEVWQLCRTNCPRKEIAKKLFISLSTVKKHVKSILAKRRMTLNDGWN